MVANSRDVAAYFGKAHKHVLRDIEEIESRLSAQIWTQWFLPTETEVHVGFGTRKDPGYDMNRDGFTLLVMGFTGTKADAFKLAYLNEYNRNTIRVVELDGNPWFVAVDVSRVLGLTNTTMALRPLGSDEKGLNPIETIRGVQMMNTVSESGLYKLILRTDKPQAREFQDWVTRVVLPTIRKEGAYVAGEENIGKGTEEDDEALVLRAMKIMERKIEKLKEERERARLERDRAIEDKDAMKESVGTYLHTVRDYVKMLDPRINLGMVARTLVDLGYYRNTAPNCYRVRHGSKAHPRPYRHHQGRPRGRQQPRRGGLL